MRLTDAEQWILPFIGVGQKNAAQREYLSAISGLDDRTMRQGIELLRQEYPIVNLQNGAGYYLSYDKRELRRYHAQEMSRIKSKIAALRGVRKALEAGRR